MEKLLKTKDDHEQFLFWIGTLMAGVIPQGRQALELYGECCCLGVGVYCTVPIEKLDMRKDDTLSGGMPSQQKYAPNWLKNIAEYCRQVGFNITHMNDGGVPHQEIAEMLMKHYEAGEL